MKRSIQLLVLSVLISSVQLASASVVSTFPADAEASHNLPAIESYADRHARKAGTDASWGVSMRQQQTSVFPSGGGYIDD
jgi:hypothetical protein